MSKINTHLIDCMEFMADKPDNYYDLSIVDVPYGINVNISMGRRSGDKKSSYHKFYGNDTESPDKDYFNELIRVSKNQIIWGANHFIENIPNANSKSWIVWDKKFSNDVSFASAELAHTTFNKTIKIYTEHPNSKIRIHPTEKPIDLYKWLLKNYANSGDNILDTHGGSFSHAIACYDLGFYLDICELDPDYYKDGTDRLNNHIKKCEEIKQFGFAKTELNKTYPTLF